RLADVHFGHVVQPSPDSLSLTAPPVQMISVEAITPASAILLMTSGVGLMTMSAHDRSRRAGEAWAVGCDNGWADTAPIVWSASTQRAAWTPTPCRLPNSPQCLGCRRLGHGRCW